jgi:hypothetical protein
MNRWRVGEDRGSKETDRRPLTGWFDAREWRAKCHRLCICGELSSFCMQEVIVFCLT